jgi:hypothetical protein
VQVGKALEQPLNSCPCDRATEIVAWTEMLSETEADVGLALAVDVELVGGLAEGAPVAVGRSDRQTDVLPDGDRRSVKLERPARATRVLLDRSHPPNPLLGCGADQVRRGSHEAREELLV